MFNSAGLVAPLAPAADWWGRLEDEVEELGLNQPQEPDPQQVAVTENIQIQTEKLISDIENQDAKTLQVKVDTQQATIEAYERLIDTFKTQAEAGIPLSEADHNIRVKQQDIVMEGQQALDEGPNREQAASIVSDMQQQALLEQQAQQANQQLTGLSKQLTVEQPSTSIGQDNL